MTGLIQVRIPMHLKEIIIVRLDKNKAWHTTLSAITGGKVNENKICIELTVTTQTKK